MSFRNGGGKTTIPRSANRRRVLRGLVGCPLSAALVLADRPVGAAAAEANAGAAAGHLVSDTLAAESNTMTPQVTADGTAEIGPVAIPYSRLASAEAKASFVRSIALDRQEAVTDDIGMHRRAHDQRLAPGVGYLRSRFSVSIYQTAFAAYGWNGFRPKGQRIPAGAS